MNISQGNSNPAAVQKILLVDDHELVRAGIRLLIENALPEAQIIEASTGLEGIEVQRTQPVDLVFMDIVLPGIDGISAALRMLNVAPATRVIILTGRTELVVPKALLNSGICGYITKSSAAEEIHNAIKASASGELFLSRDLRRRHEANQLTGGETSPFDRLSSRELQVVLLLLKGYKTGVVGDALLLNAKTVSTYKRRAFDKLGVDNTADLIKLAMKFSILGY